MATIQVIRRFVQNVKKKKGNKLILPLLLLAEAFLFSSYSSQREVLSHQERNELESFFRKLFTKSEFAYSLFGNKPMSFYTYFIKIPKTASFNTNFLEPKIEKYDDLFKRGYSFFNTNNFLLIDQPFISDKFPTKDCVRDILILNKEAFILTIDNHSNLFEKRLGRHVTGKELLLEIESGKNVLSEVLSDDEFLWGLLLGYGKKNAELYAEREEIIDICNSKNLKKEKTHLTGFSNEYYLHLIPLPMFLCDKDSIETKTIKHKYLKTQEKVFEVYTSSSFLDLILNQLQG